MKILSLFSGIGAFEKALDNMGVNYELVNYCEIDKYASKSYAAIHGVPESKNLGDITKVDTSKLPNDIDLISYGFPCQDISLAGKQRGFTNEDGERTRSGLFFEALRLIEDLQPKVAICENVKNLTSKKFANEFQIVLESLEEAGYKNYWKVLNAKDYGIPQNRERVFIISIREDIDKGYEFPEPFPLELRLKDMLDDVVDEKYYLSNKMISYVLDLNETQKESKWSDRCNSGELNPEVAHTLSVRGAGGCQRAGVSNFVLDNVDDEISVKDLKKAIDPRIIVAGKTKSGGERSRIIDTRGIATSLTATDYKQPQQIVEPVCLNSKGGRGGVDGLQPSVQDRVYDSEAISTAVTTSYMPSVLVKEATKQGYAEAYDGDSINLEQPNSKTRRGRVGKGVAQTLTTSPQQAVVEPVAAAMRGRYNSDGELEQRVEISDRDYGNALTTAQKDSMVCEPTLRIRKLTPLECFRLMGFSDDDFYRAEKVNSNTQLYKQAGNSIVVDVIEELYEQLFDLYWDEVR